ncbi:hypothetical protein BE20_23600 [Sorangium cellulosum]|uniref:Transposase for insertion sequence element IS21-like C-terminal domain-containing protein n=1 Tax=Sorangium cellulosum TaxID=56 RepID=A0A150RMU4_SORCE|nr:hypothetical protein BE18_18460 [Sorangium cellulosum]KYF88219.1 hypothetical protein BE20_23600 [Sorangium cellulosum]
MKRRTPTRTRCIERISRSLIDHASIVLVVFAVTVDLSFGRLARVNIDYHVVFDDRFYSVPYARVHEEVWVKATVATVEIVLRNRRIALHPRSRARGKHSTVREHMPSAHRAHAEWTPSRPLAWAERIGPATRQLCAAILTEQPHPEQGFPGGRPPASPRALRARAWRA